MEEVNAQAVEDPKAQEDPKKAEFEKSPENFINIFDCLLVVKREEREEKKFFSVLNNCKSIEDVFMAEGFVSESLQNRRDQIRVIQAQKAHEGIQLAGAMPVNKRRHPFRKFFK